MLRVMKSTGRVLDTRANDGQKGKKGRVEFDLIRQSDGDFILRFEEFGNYGKSRWHSDVLMTEDDLNELSLDIAQFLQSKNTSSLPEFQVSEAKEIKNETQETKQENKTQNKSKESKQGFQKLDPKEESSQSNKQEDNSASDEAQA